MNAALLLDQFDRLAAEPGAIPKLRRLVLDLAVRGKLVPQEAGDEPAEVLPQYVASTQTAIPEGWLAATLEGVFELNMGQSPPSSAYNKHGEGLPFFQGKADFGDLYPSARYWCTEPSKIAEAGDILLSVRAPVGPTNIADQTCCIGRGLAALRQKQCLVTNFGHLLLRAFAPAIEAMGFGTTFVAVNKKQLRCFVFPIPPLAEQARIVARVDELMSRLDALEAAQTAREDARARFTAASHARLSNPDPEPETFRAHAGAALGAFTPLTTRPAQVDALRQTILSLAVRGKLVEQDPADEPVEELLRQITADKKRRAVSARDRRAGPIRPLESPGAFFEIPASWHFVNFGDVTISRDGERVPVSKAERENRAKIYDYYGASGVIDKIDGYLFDKPLLLIGEDGANLINRSTPIAFIARGKYWVNNHAHVLDGISEGFLRYLCLFINAIDLKPFVTGTAQPKMNQAKMNSIPVAVPPLAEQRRIVEKVDRLMALCDRLERALSEAGTSRAKLLDAAIREALQPSQEAREAAE